MLGVCGWREMTLHLALSFINIIPVLWCSGGGRHRELFVMQYEEIKALGTWGTDFSSVISNWETEQDCATWKGGFSVRHVCSSLPQWSVHSAPYGPSFVRFRSHAIPHCGLQGTACPEMRSYPLKVAKKKINKKKRPRRSSTPLCHPKHSSHSSVWAMPLSNTCSPCKHPHTHIHTHTGTQTNTDTHTGRSMHITLLRSHTHATVPTVLTQCPWTDYETMGTWAQTCKSPPPLLVQNTQTETHKNNYKQFVSLSGCILHLYLVVLHLFLVISRFFVVFLHLFLVIFWIILVVLHLFLVILHHFVLFCISLWSILHLS